MRIAIVFGNDGSDVRLGKTCRSLMKSGHDVHFVGWDRRPDVAKVSDLGGATRHVVPCATPFGHSTWWAQLRFSWHTFRTLVRIRPDVVCAVNEDNAVRVLPFRGILYRRLVCDVYDSHRDRGSDRALPIRWALTALSELARVGADALVATDETRFQRFGRRRYKTTVVGNYPEDPGPELARTKLAGPTRICVCGTLTETRGLRQLLEAVEQSQDVKIVAAGWPNDDFAANVFVKHARVEYHGIVTSRQALELAAGCDAVFAYYAPICRNNVFASPNKIYDAMSVGRPVVLNSEAIVSQWVVESELGFACRYADVGALAQIVDSLYGLRQGIAAASERARRMFVKGYSWEKMEERLAAIYSGRRAMPISEVTVPKAA